LRDNLPFDFAVRYAAARPDLKPDFAIDAAALQEFRSFIRSRNFKYDEPDFEASSAAIALRLRAQVARVKWGPEAESAILATADAQLQKALTVFDEARRLAEDGERSRREKERQSAEVLKRADS
jgi:hypothetical protein